MPSPFINDGHTREVTIEATPRYDAVTLTYRPMLRTERDRLLLRTARAAEKGDLQVEEAIKAVAASLAKHIADWDVAIPPASEGEPAKKVEITAENILRLEPNFFERLYDVIAGFKSRAERDAEEARAEKNLSAGSG